MFDSGIFTTRLKQIRESRNLTLKHLGEEIGVAKQTVGNWENGVRIPPLPTIWKLADYYNVTVDYLIGRSDKI